MKTALFLSLLLVLIAPLHAADNLTTALQQGLFEEEANRNLDKAIEAYQSLVTQFDKDRQIGATAVFRLGECYRKLGRTNEAILQYERIVREFPDQATLATLSRQNLTGLGKIATAAGAAKTQDGNNSVSVTIDDEETEIRRLQTLLQTSPDLLNSASKDSLTPLQLAARDGKYQVAQFLLAAGADVGGGTGMKALHYAAAAGHRAVVELLLGKGAKVDGADWSGPSPLHFAVTLDRRAVAETLIRAKAPVDARVHNGRYSRTFEGGASVRLSPRDTPLFPACRTGNRFMVDLLLAAGADVTAENEDLQSPLTAAIAGNHLEIATLLVAKGANPNSPQRGVGGVPPLGSAINEENFNLVNLLLKNGADPNARDLWEITLLFRAIPKNGTTGDAMVKALLDAGARVDATVRQGSLDHAGWLPGGSQSERRLIGPLAYASMFATGQTNKIASLLEHGADIETRTADGYSSLDFAVQFDATQAAAMLIARGADVNRRDPNGVTPLWQACQRGNMAMARLLLEAKADPNLATSSGTTLLDSVHRSADLVVLLKQFGARDDFPRWNQIRWARGAEKPSLWKSGDPQNSWDRFTLLEMIVSTKPTFPDLTKVRILRPQRDGGSAKAISVNVEELIASEDRTRDPWLEWGDVVEIPTLDHALSATWPGFENEKVEKLVRILQRQVTLICGGQTNQAQLVSRGAIPNTFKQNVYVDGLLSARVLNSKLLRTSSDLGRVTLRRIDPATRKAVELTVDGRNWSPPGVQQVPPFKPVTDVWLRDGDIIEVPEKTER